MALTDNRFGRLIAGLTASAGGFFGAPAAEAQYQPAPPAPQVNASVLPITDAVIFQFNGNYLDSAITVYYSGISGNSGQQGATDYQRTSAQNALTTLRQFNAFSVQGANATYYHGAAPTGSFNSMTTINGLSMDTNPQSVMASLSNYQNALTTIQGFIGTANQSGNKQVKDLVQQGVSAARVYTLTSAVLPQGGSVRLEGLQQTNVNAGLSAALAATNQKIRTLSTYSVTNPGYTPQQPGYVPGQPANVPQQQAPNWSPFPNQAPQQQQQQQVQNVDLPTALNQLQQTQNDYLNFVSQLGNVQLPSGYTVSGDLQAYENQRFSQARTSPGLQMMSDADLRATIRDEKMDRAASYLVPELQKMKLTDAQSAAVANLARDAGALRNGSFSYNSNLESSAAIQMQSQPQNSPLWQQWNQYVAQQTGQAPVSAPQPQMQPAPQQPAAEQQPAVPANISDNNGPNPAVGIAVNQSSYFKKRSEILDFMRDNFGAELQEAYKTDMPAGQRSPDAHLQWLKKFSDSHATDARVTKILPTLDDALAAKARWEQAAQDNMQRLQKMNGGR